MTFDELRRKFGDILRESVPPKGFEKVFKEADRMGRVTPREIHNMIITLYNYLEDNDPDGEATPTNKAL